MNLFRSIQLFLVSAIMLSSIAPAGDLLAARHSRSKKKKHARTAHKRNVSQKRYAPQSEPVGSRYAPATQNQRQKPLDPEQVELEKKQKRYEAYITLAGLAISAVIAAIKVYLEVRIKIAEARVRQERARQEDLHRAEADLRRAQEQAEEDLQRAQERAEQIRRQYNQQWQDQNWQRQWDDLRRQAEEAQRRANEERRRAERERQQQWQQNQRPRQEQPRQQPRAEQRNELPHEVLGVPAGANRAQIIRAYRDLALLFHPDRYEANREQLRARGIHEPQQAGQRMAQINDARDVLLQNL